MAPDFVSIQNEGRKECYVKNFPYSLTRSGHPATGRGGPRGSG